MSEDKELPVFVTECEEENARLKERIAELEAHVERLRKWVRDECVDKNHFCDFLNDAALALLEETPTQSLAAIRREAMEETRVACIEAIEEADGGPCAHSMRLAEMPLPMKGD